MIIGVTSDLHGWLPAMPQVDLAIIAGDFVPTWIDQYNKSKPKPQEYWLAYKFSKWYQESIDLKRFTDVIAVPGNHCSWATTYSGKRVLTQMGIKVLINQSLKYHDLHIYGSPDNIMRPSKDYPDGRWDFEKTQTDLATSWDKIPTDTDILITHQNPYLGIEEGLNLHTPNKELSEWILANQPSLHVWGHEHSLTGLYSLNNTISIDAAATDDSGLDYDPFGHVFVVDYDEHAKTVRNVEKVLVNFTYCRNKYKSPYDSSST